MRRFAVITVALLLVLSRAGIAAAQHGHGGHPSVTESPVGVWEVHFVDRDKGTIFMTFDEDGDVFGYGLSKSSGHFFTLEGVWGVDENGQLEAFVTEDVAFDESDEEQFIEMELVGSVKHGKLKAAWTGLAGQFKITGVPASTCPDLSGSWAGHYKSNKVTSTIEFDLFDLSDDGFPCVFAIEGDGTGPVESDGNGGDCLIGGYIIADHAGKLNLYFERFFFDADTEDFDIEVEGSLTGQVSKKSELKFSGVDDDAQKVSGFVLPVTSHSD